MDLKTYLFVYQPTLDTLELKKDKGTYYILSWKSNGVYNSKLKPLYTAFVNSIKLSGYRMRIKFEKEPLVIENKNSDKKNYVYSGHGITFDNAGSWSFRNGTAKNVIIFDVDDSSSSHVDNRKNNFGKNGRFASSEKKCSINFTKANTKFCLSLHCNADNSLFVC